MNYLMILYLICVLITTVIVALVVTKNNSRPPFLMVAFMVFMAPISWLIVIVFMLDIHAKRSK